MTSAQAGPREACHDAPIRACRAGPEIRPQRQRGAAQPRLCLRHASARPSEARVGRSVFLASPEVAAILTELKLDDPTIAAALLHDVIEDPEGTRAEIEQEFGKENGA